MRIEDIWATNAYRGKLTTLSEEFDAQVELRRELSEELLGICDELGIDGDIRKEVTRDPDENEKLLFMEIWKRLKNESKRQGGKILKKWAWRAVLNRSEACQ